ncbi:MAG: hypothetical protein ACRBCJ_12260 [Hyphomicrobiaceae bacterium]
MRKGLRVLFGFIWACLIAGVVTVLFIETPLELAKLPGIPLLEKISELTVLALRVATHSAIFSAPFVLLVALVGEWAHIRNWLYYAGAGMIIAALGLLLQYASEVGGQPTIINGYAILTFLTTGFLAGFAYWLFAGRRAGGRIADPEFVYKPVGRTPLHKRFKTPKSSEATTEIRSDPKPKASPTPPPSPKASSENSSQQTPPSNRGTPNHKGNKDRGTSVPITNRPVAGGSKPTES